MSSKNGSASLGEGQPHAEKEGSKEELLVQPEVRGFWKGSKKLVGALSQLKEEQCKFSSPICGKAEWKWCHLNLTWSQQYLYPAGPKVLPEVLRVQGDG